MGDVREILFPTLRFAMLLVVQSKSLLCLVTVCRYSYNKKVLKVASAPPFSLVLQRQNISAAKDSSESRCYSLVSLHLTHENERKRKNNSQ